MAIRKRKINVLTLQMILTNQLKKVWNMKDREIATLFIKYNILKYIDTCYELFNSTGERGIIDKIEEFISLQGGCIYEGLREQQISRRFPNQYLGLDNIQRNREGIITSADVVYTDFKDYRQINQAIERDIVQWFSGEPTLLENTDILRITEKKLDNYVGQLIDTRQLEEIYDTYILLSNVEMISFSTEYGEIISFTEGILEGYSKNEWELDKKQSNSLIIYNSKQEKRLQERIKMELFIIEYFKEVCKLTNKQLVDFMDKNNVWESFDKIKDITEFNGFTGEEVIEFFNPELNNIEIEQLVEEHDFGNDGPVESLTEQSAGIIKYLILDHELTTAQAFRQWYHSKTKKFIEDNKLYHLSDGRCLWEYLSELIGIKDEYLFVDLIQEMKEKNEKKKKVTSIIRY